MKSECVQPLLNALADGELNAWTAARVRRHVKTCADCRAEYEAIQALGVEVRHWRSVAAPAGLQARLAEVITQLPPSAEQISMPPSTLPFAPLRRRSAVRWQPLVGAGAGAAALIGAALLIPGSPGRPSIAFADVQRAMQSIKAISWVQTETRYDLQGKMTLQATQHIWIRRDPPAYAEQDSASSIPQKPSGEYAKPKTFLSDAHWQINFHVQDGVYYLHPPRNITREVQEQIDALADAQWAPGKAEQVVLNRHPVFLFRQHFHDTRDTVDNYKLPPALRVMDGDIFLWVDPKSRRVLRRRTDIVCGPERTVQDAQDFQYDQPAPVGVFNLAPPPGARVTQDDGKGNKTVVAPK